MFTPKAGLINLDLDQGIRGDMSVWLLIKGVGASSSISPPFQALR